MPDATLEELARSPQPHQQRIALERLAELAPDARQTKLVALLRDDAHAARELALQALDQLFEGRREAVARRLLEMLESLLDEGGAPNGTIQALVVALRPPGLLDDAEEARFRERLLALSDHRNADVRYQARAAREVRGESGPEYVESLLDWLDDRDADIRVVAAQGLARLGIERAIAPLRSALERAGHRERSHLLLALARLGAPGLVDDLLIEARRGGSRFAAFKALAEYGDDDAIEPLMKMATSWFGDPLQKVAAARAAAMLGADDAARRLEKLASSRRREVRGYALEAMLDAEVEGAAEEVVAAATAPKDRARLHAITLLARLPDGPALLRELAADEDPDVRAAAEAGLSELTGDAPDAVAAPIGDAGDRADERDDTDDTDETTDTSDRQR